jgi:hypothetical protein
MRTHYLLKLHQRAAACLELILQAEERQRIKSAYAAATYLPWGQAPVWASFEKERDKARAEAAFAPKVVARLQKSYANIVHKINQYDNEKPIA